MPTDIDRVNRIVRSTVLALLCVAVMLPATSGATGQKLYRWVDKQGNVYYGDKIPPEYAEQGNKELSEQGVVVKTTAPPMTEKQRAEEQRKAQLKAEQERITREKAAHDRMLLNTFSTEEDLILTRNGKVAAIDAMIKATHSRIDSLKVSLNSLRAAAAERERNGQTITDKLRNDIEAMRAQIRANLDYIATKQSEQEQLRAQFESDLERFRELKAVQAEMAKRAGQPAPAKP